MNLPKWHEDTSSHKTLALANFIVTLRLFEIGFKTLEVDELGPRLWEYTYNAYNSRLYNRPIDIGNWL
jgi:hypothetical protein